MGHLSLYYQALQCTWENEWKQVYCKHISFRLYFVFFVVVVVFPNMSLSSKILNNNGIGIKWLDVPIYVGHVPVSRLWSRCPSSLLVGRCFRPSAKSMKDGSQAIYVMKEKLKEWKSQKKPFKELKENSTDDSGTRQETHNTAPVSCVSCLVATSGLFLWSYSVQTIKQAPSCMLLRNDG